VRVLPDRVIVAGVEPSCGEAALKAYLIPSFTPSPFASALNAVDAE